MFHVQATKSIDLVALVKVSEAGEALKLKWKFKQNISSGSRGYFFFTKK
jgi:hypothetical protein